MVLSSIREPPSCCLCSREATAGAYGAELVAHGAGRIADFDDLNLAAGGVQTEKRGVKLNEFLQSVSNPNVYAAGDASDVALPKLTPVAGTAAGLSLQFVERKSPQD
jgi:pyruvate/2-oxoglutarate dehydrogenase complex dihydrolipoamide dehydrogenase (E3) component